MEKSLCGGGGCIWIGNVLLMGPGRRRPLLRDLCHSYNCVFPVNDDAPRADVKYRHEARIDPQALCNAFPQGGLEALASV